MTNTYRHRRKDDETWDSICLACFLTAASAFDEDSLYRLEHNHRCSIERIQLCQFHRRQVSNPLG
jgi:hypothetical protein